MTVVGGRYHSSVFTSYYSKEEGTSDDTAVWWKLRNTKTCNFGSIPLITGLMTLPIPRHVVSLEQVTKSTCIKLVLCSHMSTRGIRVKGLGIVGMLGTLPRAGDGLFFSRMLCAVDWE